MIQNPISSAECIKCVQQRILLFSLTWFITAFSAPWASQRTQARYDKKSSFNSPTSTCIFARTSSCIAYHPTTKRCSFKRAWETWPCLHCLSVRNPAISITKDSSVHVLTLSVGAQPIVPRQRACLRDALYQLSYTEYMQHSTVLVHVYESQLRSHRIRPPLLLTCLAFTIPRKASRREVGNDVSYRQLPSKQTGRNESNTHVIARMRRLESVFGDTTPL
jgi:hypothetical protein